MLQKALKQVQLLVSLSRKFGRELAKTGGFETMMTVMQKHLPYGSPLMARKLVQGKEVKFLNTSDQGVKTAQWCV